jgi:type IV pilus assembly protein PilW
MNKYQAKQRGFSLIEIMVGLVIGLLATLVIMNVFSQFEQQKRTTTGSSDAQTNGAVALFNVQRDIQNAGYGLPVYGSEFSPFNCPINTVVDHDNSAATPTIGLSPVVITNGNGANGSDTISIRMGNSMQGGIAVSMEAGTAANVARVDTNMGCTVNDVALVINQPVPGGALNCSMTRVTGATAVPVTISLASVTNVAVGNSLSCLGVWNEVQYAVTANQLTRTGALVGVAPNIVPNAAAVPIVPDIVNVQAQYGISAAPTSNQVTQWVDATVNAAGDFANPSLLDRNRIKAIRIAVVARNGELERANVTNACSSLIANAPTGLCAWDGGAAGSAAPAINLAADPNWQRYRYRVYESVIPIKSVIWARCVFAQTC